MINLNYYPSLKTLHEVLASFVQSQKYVENKKRKSTSLENEPHTLNHPRMILNNECPSLTPLDTSMAMHASM
jgi:hypothetical protein